MPGLENRIQALEARVDELVLVVLTIGGTERAWQLAMLGILEAIGAVPEVAETISEQLETTRRSLVDSGASYRFVESFDTAGSLILATLRQQAVGVDVGGKLH